MTNETKVLGIQMDIAGKKVTLTMEEARELHSTLDQLFTKINHGYSPFDVIETPGPYKTPVTWPGGLLKDASSCVGGSA